MVNIASSQIAAFQIFEGRSSFLLNGIVYFLEWYCNFSKAQPMTYTIRRFHSRFLNKMNVNELFLTMIIERMFFSV